MSCISGVANSASQFCEAEIDTHQPYSFVLKRGLDKNKHPRAVVTMSTQRKISDRQNGRYC